MRQKSQNVASKTDFVTFMSFLIDDFKNNSSSWENKNLDSYLEAIKSWVEDMDGFYENSDIPVPNEIDWNVFSDILMAARVYE